MRLSSRLSLFLTLAWTLVLFGGWALLAERTSEAAPPAYHPDLEFNVLAHIPVGDDPRGIAVVGDKVYVANHDDDSLSVIDADTLTVTQEITAGISNPCSIAYNPSNRYLYVTNRPESGNGTVAVISPTTGLTVTNPIVVGTKPTGIAFNPNDGYIYVVMNDVPGSVWVISGISFLDTVTDTDPISLNWPAHIAVKEASNLLYVTNHGGTVSVIDGSTRTVTEELQLNLEDLWGIAVDQTTGWVYAAARTGGELGRIQPNDTVTDSIKPDPPASLGMVAVDSYNQLVFVTEDEPDASPTGALEHVLVFDAEAGDWVDEFEITVQQDPERGMAFDPVKNRLYVSNRISNTVTVIGESVGEIYLPIIMRSFS
ncbi:MAG: YncE family protein [Anaerolineae bacterium]